MIGLTVIAVGGLKESWYKSACGEYLKRLTAFCAPKVVEIEESRVPKRPSPAEIEKSLSREGKAILAQLGRLPKNTCKTGMFIEGEAMSSEGLSARVRDIQQKHPHMAFIIGGSHGLSNEVRDSCDFTLSMSRMTLPHRLARVVLLEQLYRAFSINANIGYHK